MRFAAPVKVHKFEDFLSRRHGVAVPLPATAFNQLANNTLRAGADGFPEN
jgi:hypothetical protein